MAASSVATSAARADAFVVSRLAERRFYLGMAVGLLAAVVLGFARTFFLRPWFTEYAAANSAPEPVFYVHGAIFTAWYVLLVVQAALVASQRVDVHRRLGFAGAVLAALMVLLGFVVSAVAAGRPSGFVGVPVPPLQFLVVPIFAIVLFGALVALAVVFRRDVQAHKRYMLFASIAMAEAGVARWPTDFVRGPSPIPYLDAFSFVTDLFILPIVAWDLVTRRRVHPVTAWAGVATVAVHMVRGPLSGTAPWLAFAGWLVDSLGGR